MRGFWATSNSNLRKSELSRVGIVLFLVACALLIQRLGQYMLSPDSMSQAAFIEQLGKKGVEVVTMNRVVAPLTIPGEQVQLRGEVLSQPVEVDVYEDIDNVIHIRNNGYVPITSEPLGALTWAKVLRDTFSTARRNHHGKAAQKLHAKVQVPGGFGNVQG